MFADGFESGNLSAWTSSAGLVVENTDVRSGGFAAEGNTTTGNTFAKKTLGSTYADAYARVGFELKSQVSQVNLLRMRDAAGVSIGYVYVSTTGKLGFHNDTLNTNTVSARRSAPAGTRSSCTSGSTVRRARSRSGSTAPGRRPVGDRHGQPRHRAGRQAPDRRDAGRSDLRRRVRRRRVRVGSPRPLTPSAHADDDRCRHHRRA